MNEQTGGLDVEKQPAIKAGWLRAILFFVVVFVAQIVGAILMAIVYGVKGGDDVLKIANSPSAIPAQLFQLLPIFLVVWIFCRFIDRRSLVALGFRFDAAKRKDLVWGILWGVGLVVAVFAVLLAYGGIEVTGLSVDPTSLVNAAGLMALVAIGEEIVSRGYLLANLMDSMNKYVALFIVAGLFSLSHIFNPNASFIGLINIILAGLLLGIYYVHRRSLWFPIGLHFSWNFLQGPVLGSQISGLALDSVVHFKAPGNELLTGGEFGFEASLLTTGAMIVGIVILHLIYREKNQTEAAFPQAEEVSGITP